jgi:beta-lactamase regulating signal transducer with metallopeptidase domain
MSVHDAAAWWWAWTATMSVQVCVLVLIVAVLDRLLARWAWPQLRAALWLLVVIKLVLPPTLTSPVSVSQIGLLPAAQPAVSVVPTLLFWIWLAGVVVFGGLGAWRYLRLRRQWLTGAVAPEPFLANLCNAVAGRLGLGRTPRLLVQQDVSGPAVVGFLRPVVVLPASLLARGKEQIEHVLLHELAHVRRRDPLVAFVCLVLQLGYWFHPGVWWARQRLAMLRELCCDQAVADVLQEATPRYRRTLLELSRPLIDGHPQTLGAGGLGFIHRHSQLLARLDWLQRPLPRYPLVRRIATVSLCSWMLLCCVPLGRPPVAVAMAATDTASASMAQPQLDELAGCMRLRFAVFRALADEERRTRKN